MIQKMKMSNYAAASKGPADPQVSAVHMGILFPHAMCQTYRRSEYEEALLDELTWAYVLEKIDEHQPKRCPLAEE